MEFVFPVHGVQSSKRSTAENGCIPAQTDFWSQVITTEAQIGQDISSRATMIQSIKKHRCWAFPQGLDLGAG